MKTSSVAFQCVAVFTSLATLAYYCNDEPESITSTTGPTAMAGEAKSKDLNKTRVPLAAGGADKVIVRNAWERTWTGPPPQPDCRVDVLHTIRSDGDKHRTFVLIENVRVLSCDAESPEWDTVLHLSPDHAQKVIKAQQTGTLTLVFHKAKSLDYVMSEGKMP